MKIKIQARDTYTYSTRDLTEWQEVSKEDYDYLVRNLNDLREVYKPTANESLFITEDRSESNPLSMELIRAALADKVRAREEQAERTTLKNAIKRAQEVELRAATTLDALKALKAAYDARVKEVRDARKVA